MADAVQKSATEADKTPSLRGINQSGMRAGNERLVLSLVRQNGALSKSQIARMTGLSAQTVSVIMRALETEGLLTRGEPVRGKVGQPSVPMRLNDDGAYFLGLKVGRRSTEMVLTDFVGKVRKRALKTYAYPTPEETLSFADREIHRLIEFLAPENRLRVAGLGIAMPFFLWDWAQTLNVPPEKMDPWRTADLRGELAARHNLPIFVQNDMTAACGAELVFGPQTQARNFLYFYIGYFIGGGVVLDGRIYSGNGNAGAMGPLPVAAGTGTVEPLLNPGSLVTLERALVNQGHSADTLWETADNWNVPEPIIAHWRNGAARGIAHAIVAACSVIDFECVIIDGWMPTNVRDALVAETNTSVSSFNLTGLNRPRVQAGSIGPDARALGAASLPLSVRYLSQ